MEFIYRGGDRLGRRWAILGRMTGQPEMIQQGIALIELGLRSVRGLVTENAPGSRYPSVEARSEFLNTGLLPGY